MEKEGKGQNFKLRNVLISGGINPEYETFDWFGDVVAYGCDNLVFIYDVKKIKILCSLKSHSGRVNCVKFTKEGKIISVCSKGEIVIWKNEKFGDLKNYLENEEDWGKWEIEAKQVIKGRNILQFSLYEENENLIYGVFLTTKSDLHFFRIERGDNKSSFSLKSIETLDFGNNLLECSTIVEFSETRFILVSSSDFKIHVYRISTMKEESEEKEYLEYLNSLQGHADKISSLSSVNLGIYAPDAPTFIASGSRDNYIKIWKFVKDLDDSVLLTAMKRNIYRVGEHFVYLESSLIGHADSVSSVQWSFKNCESEEDRDPENLILLSSSLDFSIQIWEREEKSKVNCFF